MESHTDSTHALAIIQGTPLDALPTDLYIPPEALRVFLESFEGPLDLLLYLIQKQNFDILNVPIAKITEQYYQYIELMSEFHLDLAAEYLVMAATLTEIKSRMLLPSPEEVTDPSFDPRAKLIKQLQEYARYKKVAEELFLLPQVERDIFLATAAPPEMRDEVLVPEVSWEEFLSAMQDVMARATLFSSHHVMREPLSVRERMAMILDRLKLESCVNFTHLFTYEEGRPGVVVTLLAILELVRESIIQIVQLQQFGNIQVIGINLFA